MKLLSTLVLALSLSGSVFACTEDGSTGFLPENDLSIPTNSKLAGGITEAQFNAVIDKYETIYAPIVTSMKGKLSINRKWDDATVNANASRFSGVWMVNMYGGLARHPAITEDGFALVLCHELGHQLGGAPKISTFNPINKWASNEGQSDYFATTKCLRKGWLNDNNSAIVKKLKAPATLTNKCRQVWGSSPDYDICVRGGMAGASVAALFAALRNQPEAKFETPDANVVKKTDDSHPAHQCRLDTYFQGALCEKSFNEDVSQKDENVGTCTTKMGNTIGTRPLCWFKAKK